MEVDKAFRKSPLFLRTATDLDSFPGWRHRRWRDGQQPGPFIRWKGRGRVNI
jgi:hypothetical protein